MKYRYIVRTYVEASTPQEALKVARKISPHDVFLDQDVWKEQGWTLGESEIRPLGFTKK